MKLHAHIVTMSIGLTIKPDVGGDSSAESTENGGSDMEDDDSSPIATANGLLEKIN